MGQKLVQNGSEMIWLISRGSKKLVKNGPRKRVQTNGARKGSKTSPENETNKTGPMKPGQMKTGQMKMGPIKTGPMKTGPMKMGPMKNGSFDWYPITEDAPLWFLNFWSHMKLYSMSAKYENNLIKTRMKCINQW